VVTAKKPAKKVAAKKPAAKKVPAKKRALKAVAGAAATLAALVVAQATPEPDRFSATREAQVAYANTTPEVTEPLAPLTPQHFAAQAEMASRVLARRRLLPFVERMNDRYDAGWVHEDICRRLEKFSEDVAKGLSPRLMLLMPPRHGKSELASKNFPAWHLGRHPEHEFIACSYNLSLAMGFSRKVKQIMDDAAYKGVFEVKLDPNNQSTEEWGIAGERGGYVAAGIGGPITGKGAHVLVIDDPVKNAEEADSADGREKTWEWYLSTAYTRLAPGGGVLIIQTWWHDDDLAGRVQQMMRQGADDEDIDQFDVVKYPAIAEADEYLNDAGGIVYDEPWADLGDRTVFDATTRANKLLRYKGEALHPTRYDLKKLAKIRALNRKQDGTDGRWWSALYQQNPVPDDGGYFMKAQFKRAELPETKRCNVFMAWDFAISEKKQNDYTVGVVGLQDDDDLLHIAEVNRFKSSDSFFIVESILNMCARWPSASLVLGFEDGQIYRAIEALLKKRMRERRMYPSIVVLKPITDKLARARALQGRMQQGMVSFSSTGQWYDVARAEMLRFPAGVHDDQVDALAWMTTMVVGREAPRKLQAPKVKSWRDRLNLGAGGASHMAA
jgi:predicted phage terminase large subunit-like protein